MKKGKVIYLNFYGDTINFVLRNYVLIIITIFFLSGLIFGVFLYGNNSFVTNSTTEYLKDFITKRESFDFINLFIDSFFNSMLYIVLSFCIGTSMFGILTLMPLIVFRAFSYGSLIASLYLQYNIKGIAFNAVMLLPYSIFFIIAFILSCCESFKFSIILVLQTYRAGEYRNITLCFKKYCIKHILILILILISAILDSVISLNFLKDFNLL